MEEDTLRGTRWTSRGSIVADDRQLPSVVQTGMREIVEPPQEATTEAPAHNQPSGGFSFNPVRDHRKQAREAARKRKEMQKR